MLYKTYINIYIFPQDSSILQPFHLNEYDLDHSKNLLFTDKCNQGIKRYKIFLCYNKNARAQMHRDKA